MRRGLAISTIALALWAGEVLAQDTTSAPVMGSSATAAQDQSATDQQDQTFHILVIGDALGGGLGAGLMRVVQEEPGFDVTLRFNELSGLARPELYDWSTTVPKLVEGKNFDAIVMLVGENDRQEIRADNSVYAFGTKEWTAAYQAQLDKVLAALKATGSPVYWVSLPPMADPDYEAAMRQIAALQKQQVEADGFKFVDIRNALLDANGAYIDRGPDDTGTVRTLRGRDGVSFYKAGNNLMGKIVLAAIKAGKAAAPVSAEQSPAVVAPAPAAPSGPATVAAEPGNPVFGGTGGDGAAITFRADQVATLAMGPDGQPLSAIQALAPPGSAAADLLVKGIAGLAPAGRADDFTMPQK